MANTIVQYGAQGTNAKILQQMLNRNGYKLDVDGIFGDNTLAAVKDYQQKNGLKVDGIVGQDTWGALSGDTSKTYTTTPATNPNTKGANDAQYKTNKPFTYKDFDYGDFTYGDYQESDLVKNAYDALQAQLAQKPGEYKSQWQTQLDDIINKILNREKFSYDLNGDALYQQYKDKFIQQGKMAMGDAIGQASAMTGGYGNSYAQSVGQQMYQKELQNLNDIVPELYQMALDKYNREGDELYNQYAMLGDRENMDYSRHRDSVADWLTERDYLTGRYDSERDFDYGKYADDRNFEYGKYSDDRNLAYDKYSTDKSLAYNEHRNAIEDALRREELEYQKERDRISDEQWQKEYDLAKGKVGSTGGGSGGGGSYNNGSLKPAEIKELQKILGVTVDGKWGEASRKAAGGLSADAAFEKYVLKTGERITSKNDDDYAKGLNQFDQKTYNANVSNNGGSYYRTALDDLKGMKSKGYTNAMAQNYLEELVGNSFLTQSEYRTLYNKYRDGKLG